jgi:endoglycosylceramidase
MRRLLPLLVACAGDAPEDTAAAGLPQCAIEPPAATALHAEGPDLYDGHGRRVLLRGVNTGGRSKFAPYVPFDFADGAYDEALGRYLDRARDWGFTTLRVPFSWAALEPVEGQDDEQWAGRYDALLDAAAARGMWTIVDFHQDIYGEFFCGDGFPRWTVEDPGPDRHDCPDWFLQYLQGDDVAQAFDAFWADGSPTMAAFEAMWDRMAARHADRPGVIGYEIINEPGNGLGDEATWARETLTPFYSRMAGRIQAVDPDALVFFDSTGLAAVQSRTDLERPAGENLVFAPHSYDPSVFLGADSVDPSLVADRIDAWKAIGDAWDLPIMVGEFGGPQDRANIAPYTGEHFDAFDRLQTHGTLWEYSDSAEAWNEEYFSMVHIDGTVRAEVLDAVVRAYPRALAEASSAATTWAWDAEARTLTLDYEGTKGGISEIVLPPWWFGEGVAVDGSGGCHRVAGDRLFVRGAGGAVHVTVAPGG